MLGLLWLWQVRLLEEQVSRANARADRELRERRDVEQALRNELEEASTSVAERKAFREAEGNELMRLNNDTLELRSALAVATDHASTMQTRFHQATNERDNLSKRLEAEGRARIGLGEHCTLAQQEADELRAQLEQHARSNAEHVEAQRFLESQLDDATRLVERQAHELRDAQHRLLEYESELSMANRRHAADGEVRQGLQLELQQERVRVLTARGVGRGHWWLITPTPPP